MNFGRKTIVAVVMVAWFGAFSHVRGAAAASGDYQKIGFDELASYVFTPPQYDPAAADQAKVATGEEQIPTAIKALNGRNAAITGYMVPVKMDKGLVTEFLLMRNTLACCFGGVPNMNEWVVVKLQKPIAVTMDTPVTFTGRLKVGAIVENGYVTGLYQLDGAEGR